MYIRRLFLVSALLTTSVASAAGLYEAYDLDLSRSEARDTLVNIIENARLRDGTAERELSVQVARLIRGYRSHKAPALMAIKDAPYLPLVLLQKGGQLYPAAYDARWKEEFKNVVENLQLETIFDGLIDGYIDGTLPPDLRKQASALGKCLAHRVVEGRSKSCKLDNSDHLHAPSIFSKAWVKASCFLYATSACHTRKVIFNSIKKDLIVARSSPELRRTIEAEFRQKFPPQFREGYLAELGTRVTTFPQIIQAKFGGPSGELDALWGVKTPLVEGDGESQTRISLRGFSAGLRADLGVAALLADSRDPTARAIAAPLFFAGANRLLLMTGESEAQFNGRDFVIADSFDRRFPTRPPTFATNAFGGWGAEAGPGGPVFTRWDWATYDPTRSESPTPPRLFAAEFVIGGRGTARPIPGDVPSQGLEELADLLFASLDFLRYSAPRAPLAKFFGNEQELADGLLEPTKTVIFPNDGRLLAIGVLAGVLKNLVAPNIGHLEELAEAPGLPLVFHERVTLSGRAAEKPRVRSVGRALAAAAELRRLLPADPMVPAELLEYIPKLEAALQIGALVLGAQGQESDGGFRDRLGEAQTTGRSLLNWLAGTRALTRAYNESQMLALRVRIKQAWIYLDKSWGTRLAPPAIEGEGAQSVPPSVLWEVLNTWEETQTLVRPDLAADLSWAVWDSRMGQLRKQLLQQLRSKKGPAPLSAPRP